jgi:hypothetical protein
VKHVALALRAEVLCAFEFVSAMSIHNTVYQDITLFNLEETTTFRSKLLLPSSGPTKYGLIMFVGKVFTFSARTQTVSDDSYLVTHFLTFAVFVTSLMFCAFHVDILMCEIRSRACQRFFLC